MSLLKELAEPRVHNALITSALLIVLAFFAWMIAQLMSSTPGEAANALASLLAGFFALSAGLLAFIVGRQQIAVLQEQNRELRIKERRSLARESLIAGRLLEGVLANLSDTLNVAIGQIGPNSGAGIGPKEANEIVGKVANCPIEPILSQLGLCDGDIIRNYIVLASEIQVYKTEVSGRNYISLRGIYKTDFERFAHKTSSMRSLVEGHLNRSQSFLADTEASQ